MNNNLIFTGIGSRDISSQEERTIVDISEHLAYSGFTLRSGKADGADAAFQIGYQSYFYTEKKLPNAEIYIPWANFNNKNKRLENHWDIVFGENKTAKQMVKRIHPAYHKLSEPASLLHQRNCAQVLGKDLDKPSLFVLYCADENWLNGEVSGGTRTAVELARQLRIRAFNIRNLKGIGMLKEWLSTQGMGI
jgi:hypothetical protein